MLREGIYLIDWIPKSRMNPGRRFGIFWLDTFIRNSERQSVRASERQSVRRQVLVAGLRKVTPPGFEISQQKEVIRRCVRTTGVPLGVLGTSTNCANPAFSRGFRHR